MTSVPEIAEMLRPHADSLARSLLPGGHYDANKSEWKCSGSQSPTGQAISVHVRRDAKQGVCGFWNGERRGGDLLDLIGLVRGGLKRDAVSYAKHFLGLGDERGGIVVPLSPVRKAAIERQKAARLAAEAADRETRTDLAERLWNTANPFGAVAVSYLLSRGIEPIFDGELRFHHSLRHPSGGVFPAIIARVSDVDNKLVGVWRIFLKPDGSGKAPVETPRLGLGNCAGGAVRIGGIWTEIGVAEGVENALAARQIIHNATGKLIPVWPTLSTSGLRGVILPPEVTRVRIFSDNDPVRFRDNGVTPSPGLSAAADLTARLLGEGREVINETPPAGLDWTQVLNMSAGAA